MKDLHLNIKDEIFEIVHTRKKLNKYSYSKAVEELIENSLSSDDTVNELNKIIKKLDLILSKLALVISLEKQLYSDLEIVNLTDPNKNDSLKQFFKKRISEDD